MYFNRPFIILVFLALHPFVLRAQQPASDRQSPDTQKLGQRVFEQRCSVCHTLPTINAKRYGPALYKDLVDGNEDAIREFIRSGSAGKMPGFKFGLEPSEIEAIISYLKTVPRPTQQASNGQQTPAN